MNTGRISNIVQIGSCQDCARKISNFAIQLGKRIEKVSIVNEKDSIIKVSPKGWIDRHIWREINDILRLNQFNWLSNGKYTVG